MRLTLALFVLAAAVATTTALTPSAMRVFMKKVTDDCEEKLGDKESSIARVECIREGRKKLIRRFAARDVKEEEEEEITWNEKVFKEAKLAKENDESLNCAAAAKDICDHRHWKLHELKGESRDKFEKRQKEKCKTSCRKIILKVNPLTVGLLLTHQHIGNFLIPIISNELIQFGWNITEPL